MPHRQDPKATARARELRKLQTKAELLLWQGLRNRRLHGLKFRRQFPIDPFMVDFACVERFYVVELDGAYHDYVGERDLARQHYLEEQGWTVVRFWNEDVLSDVEAVLIAIGRQTPSPQPSPPKH